MSDTPFARFAKRLVEAYNPDAVLRSLEREARKILKSHGHRIPKRGKLWLPDDAPDDAQTAVGLFYEVRALQKWIAEGNQGSVIVFGIRVGAMAQRLNLRKALAKAKSFTKPKRMTERDLKIVSLREERRPGEKKRSFGLIGLMLPTFNPKWVGPDDKPLKAGTVGTLYRRCKLGTPHTKK